MGRVPNDFSAATLIREGSGESQAAIHGAYPVLHDEVGPAASSCISIAFIDPFAFSRECSAAAFRSALPGSLVLTFESVQRFLESRTVAATVSVLVFSIYGLEAHDPEIELILSALRQGGGNIPVVLISNSDRSARVLEALSKGVRGYITRSTSVDIVVQAIRLVAAGGTFVPATSFVEMSASDTSEHSTHSSAVYFTPTQMKVLRPLSEGKATKIIAHQLKISESTVKIHIRNIMAKLKATNRTQVAIYAQRLFQEGNNAFA